MGKTDVRPAQDKNVGDNDWLLWDSALTLNIEVIISLEYCSNFWSPLDLPLINCEVERNLSWDKRQCIGRDGT